MSIPEVTRKKLSSGSCMTTFSEIAADTAYIMFLEPSLYGSFDTYNILYRS